MVRDKVRIRFQKGGALRLVSHHDLMRCFERMLRRADLPFHSTAGFNPKPRLIFALSLALGIVGCEEVAELELDDFMPPEEIQVRLSRQAPAGLDILTVSRINPKVTAQVCRVCYRVALPADLAAVVPARVTALLACQELWIDRTRPHARRFDVRPYLHGLRVLNDALEMDLQVTPTGTVRPDEVLCLLDLGAILEAGAVLKRTQLVLHDEVCAAGHDARSDRPTPQPPLPREDQGLTPVSLAAALPGNQTEGLFDKVD